MAWTQADLDTYDNAIKQMMADGLPKQIVNGDRAVTYNDLASLIEARNLIATLVATDSPGQTEGSRSSYAGHRRD